MSKSYAEQFHLSLDKTILKPVFLVKVPNNLLGKVNHSLFYKHGTVQFVAHFNVAGFSLSMCRILKLPDIRPAE